LPALRTGLCGDRLHGISGILNGTCNYILSRIETARIPFSEALKKRRPVATPKRMPPRTSMARRSRQTRNSRPGRITGPCLSRADRARTIRAVDAVDFDYATELGCTIRQISRADLKDGTMFAEVGPSLVATFIALRPRAE